MINFSNIVNVATMYDEAKKRGLLTPEIKKEMINSLEVFAEQVLGDPYKEKEVWYEPKQIYLEVQYSADEDGIDIENVRYRGHSHDHEPYEFDGLEELIAKIEED